MHDGRKDNGFTLIEMLVVIAIIAILATIAMPSFDSRIIRGQIVESAELIKTFKESVATVYRTTNVFPKNNAEAGVPKPEALLGNYVARVDVVDGVFNITFGNKVNPQIKDKILSVRPVYVKGSPESPISWVCGNSKIPEGMVAAGENLTNVPQNYLPFNCL